MFGRRRKKTVYLTLGPDTRSRKLGPVWSEIDRRLANRNCQVKVRRLKEVPRNADLVIVSNLNAHRGELPHIRKFPKEKLLLAVWEPPTVDPSNHIVDYHNLFGRVLTLYDAQANGDSTFHFHHPYPLALIDEEIPFERKKLLTMVVGNKSSSYIGELYSERRRVIEYFEAHGQGDFEFWGFGWEHHGYRNYRGTTPTPVEALKNYRFSICYENTGDLGGYITEKIFCSFNAMCVPVYWGAPNIESYIPKECYIQRKDFASIPQLHAHLNNMKAEEYLGYLDAAKAFLDSDKAHKFSYDNFIEEHTHHILDTLGLDRQSS